MCGSAITYAHSSEARAYETLKRQLAARYVDDIGAYAEAQDAFCARIESLVTNLN